MRKFLKYVVFIFLVLIVYFWFAVIPDLFSCSFPTGGWDWLGFMGIIGGISLSVWSLKKQQQLSVVPCLDVDAYTPFNSSSSHNSFRVFKEHNGKLSNDGYTILRSSQKTPDNFTTSANIKVVNKGLSTAFEINVYLCSLKGVNGLSSLNEISTKTIFDFYDKIHCKSYDYYESYGTSYILQNEDWLISPQYNLSPNSDEFNLVFDLTSLKETYHSILKFEFTDIYQNRYYQFMYLFFDHTSFAVLPVSKLYSHKKA